MRNQPNADVHELFDQLIPALTAQRDLLKHVADVTASQRGILSNGATVIQIVNGQSINASFSAGKLAGFAFRETAGATAVIRLRDGRDANADLIIPIGLNANESTRDWFLPNGISFGAGLYVEVTSGAVEGVVMLGPRLA